MCDPKMHADGLARCPWRPVHPLYVDYHDAEWGVPSHDDRHLFEMLVLESAQAGLSWFIILKKREAYRRAFMNFDPEAVARLDEHDVARLLADASIVRNRRKIESAVENARRFLEVAESFGSFDAYLWRFTEGETLQPHPRPRRLDDVPCESPESKALAKDLRARGFRFLGPVICHSYMQACGLRDDHLAGCFKARPSEAL